MLIPANEDGAPAPANQAEALLLECLRAGIGLSAQFADLQARGSPDARRTAKLLALLDEVGFLHEPGAVDPRLPERIGDYRVLAHLGSGGMGVVYLAEHVQLRRRVAVKVIHRDLAATDKARERFRREALAASRLDHPGICTIYEVGTDGEQPFLALRYVPGRDLAECLAEARARSQTMVALTDDGPLLPAILRYFEQAAQALHTAHEAGLVHRDVKPGNLMVTTRGEPVLLDFGLARFDDGTDAPNLTLSGDRLGTPAYMAPELVAGLSVDRRTDVYALGATLYEAVTLQAPYSAPTREALYRRILVGDVSRASRHNRAVPRDLEIVLATALDRDPDHRYRTAADLAEDLRRLRESLPILARRPGPLVRMQRFAQRNPVIATLLVGLLLAAGVLTWMWKQRGDALQQREAALGSARAVELALRANDGRMGPVPSLAAAIEAVEKEQNVDTLSALYAATLRSHEAARLEHDHLPTALLGNAVQFSPQGDLVLTACYDGSARLWNRAGQRVAVMFHEGLVNGAVFSPSGDRVLTAGMDGTAAVWDRSGQRLFTLPHGLGYGEVGWTDPQLHCVVWADYSPDGRRIATGCSDRRVLFWDPATGERVGAELTLHRGPPMRHAWSRDSTLLASAESDAGLDIGLAPAQVLVWRTDAPHALAVPPLMHPRAVYSVAFAPDGSRLLTACGDGHLRVFELSTGQVETEIELGGMVMQADFSADGERLLACSTNGVAGLWSRTGELLQRRNFDRTPWLRFAAGDQILGTCFANAVLRLDDELREVQVCVGHTHLCSHVALSPDGRQMVSISQDMTARLWSVIDPDMPRLIGHRSRVSGLAKLADGSILSTSSDGTRIWDLHGQQLRSLDTGDCGQGWGFALDDTRQRLAVASGGIARVYDVATGRPLFSAPAPGLHMHVHLGGVSATWLADGRLAVGGGSSPDISVHAADGRTHEVWQKSDNGVVGAMAHGTRRGLVLAAGWGGRIAIWDSQGRLRHDVATGFDNSWVHGLAVAPDERLFAAGGSDHLVRVFRLPDQGEPVELPVSPLQGHDATVVAIAWSPDGRWLATGAADGSTRLWDTSRWATVAVLRGHDRGDSGNVVNAVLFTDDSRMLLTAGDDGAIQTWPTDAATLLAIARKKLARVESGTPSIWRYLELLKKGDLAGAAAAGKEIVENAIAIRDDRALNRIAWEIVDPTVADRPRDLDLAERAVSASFSLQPKPDANGLATRARMRLSIRRYLELLKKGDLAGAAGAGRQIVENAIATGDARALNGIAWAIVDPGVTDLPRDLDLAERAITASFSVLPKPDANRLDTLARVHYWRGDYRKALAEQRRAVELADRPNLRAALEEYEKLVERGR